MVILFVGILLLWHCLDTIINEIFEKINLLALLAICIIVCLVLLVVFLLSGNMGFR
ncbi:hypothetical protein BBM1454_03590 [Bifidobacterium breve MCC 1454]|nr:hypothetical protein BBM1454_03590 [Bifidobacterium breve MCC 1454]